MEIKRDAELYELLLRLKRKPVGVKFLLKKEDYEDFDAEECTKRYPYCTLVSMATKGKSYKAHKGHMACYGSAAALGLEIPSQEILTGERRLGNGAYEDYTICRKISKGMVYCKHYTYGIAVMPLSDFTSAPDVVITVCNPFQAMRIAQGYAYSHGHIDNIKLSGMQATCQECTSYPFENDQINMSMFCSGTRMLGGWGEDEMAIGMPFHFFHSVVEGVKKTVNPLERNKGKSEIESNLASHGYEDEIDIIYNLNYDTGCYKGGAPGEPKE